MALHSSYKDFRDFQISNQFFEALKKTPPTRLQYFFRPDLDYGENETPAFIIVAER
jgi:hypothetical protein